MFIRSVAACLMLLAAFSAPAQDLDPVLAGTQIRVRVAAAPLSADRQLRATAGATTTTVDANGPGGEVVVTITDAIDPALQTELDALEKKEAKLLHKVWVAPDFSEAFDNLELIAVKKGGDPAKDKIVHRHFAQNLDHDHFGKDGGMQKYLAARKPIVAMTQAASYLLSRETFSTIPPYLLDSMQCMVSDSTGIPPKYATAAGFTQATHGKFA